MKRVFAEFIRGKGLRAIAEMLTAEGVLCPSAYDPVRNRHRRHNNVANWPAVLLTSSDLGHRSNDPESVNRPPRHLDSRNSP